jgi:hypothetical protein
MPSKLLATAVAAAALLSGAWLPSAQEDRPHLVPVSLQLDQVEPVLTAGEGAKSYRLAGRISGLAAYPGGQGIFTLYVSHAFSSGQGSARAHGAPGAFLSRWEMREHLDPSGAIFVIRSGQDAFKKLYEFSGGAYKAAERVSLSSFGPVHPAGPETGFDRSVLLVGESAPEGRAFAVTEDEAYALPMLGRFPHGGCTVLGGTGSRTVVLALEDGAESTRAAFTSTRATGRRRLRRSSGDAVFRGGPCSP